jgi:hypothetical protein
MKQDDLTQQEQRARETNGSRYVRHYGQETSLSCGYHHDYNIMLVLVLAMQQLYVVDCGCNVQCTLPLEDILSFKTTMGAEGAVIY